MHFLLFMLSVALTPYLSYAPSSATILVSGVVFLGLVLSMVEPIRERSDFVRTAFAAFDRPEDRPHTILWLWTQILASYVVLFPVLFWLDSYDRAPLITIAIIVTGIGDGLAEPVACASGGIITRPARCSATVAIPARWRAAPASSRAAFSPSR